MEREKHMKMQPRSLKLSTIAVLKYERRNTHMYTYGYFQSETPHFGSFRGEKQPSLISPQKLPLTSLKLKLTHASIPFSLPLQFCLILTVQFNKGKMPLQRKSSTARRGRRDKKSISTSKVGLFRGRLFLLFFSCFQRKSCADIFTQAIS